MPVNSAIPNVNNSACESTRIELKPSALMPASRRPNAFPTVLGLAGLISCSACMAAHASATLVTAPSIASTRLSVSSCLISRRRLAPMASRMAISRLRVLPRASSKLAMLTQAISSTKLTAPNSTSTDLRIAGSRRTSLRVRALAPQPFEFRVA